MELKRELELQREMQRKAKIRHLLCIVEEPDELCKGVLDLLPEQVDILFLEKGVSSIRINEERYADKDYDFVIWNMDKIKSYVGEGK
jgi:hypothetical protein